MLVLQSLYFSTTLVEMCIQDVRRRSVVLVNAKGKPILSKKHRYEVY